MRCGRSAWQAQHQEVSPAAGSPIAAIRASLTRCTSRRYPWSSGISLPQSPAGALLVELQSSKELHRPGRSVDGDHLAVLQLGRADAGCDDGGDAELAGDDCRVGEDSAGVGNQRADP
jgi:hypothetical protein